MATFYLIRHGSNDYLGKGIAGRLPNVHLNDQGRLEAEKLAFVLAEKGIDRIISSPLERALQTAAPLAAKLKKEIEIQEWILEVDFGDWNGATLKDLETSPLWASYNSNRSGTRIPNGELVIEIQSRMVQALERLVSSAPDSTFALFSHGDPIRAVLCYYLGIPLDFLQRFEVSPGSYSVLRLESCGTQVISLNSLPQ